jgi:hypothetical protein
MMGRSPRDRGLKPHLPFSTPCGPLVQPVQGMGGWLPGGVKGEAGSTSFTALASSSCLRWFLRTSDTHARRERRASLRRRARGLPCSNHVSMCSAKTRVRENGGREQEGNCTVTVEWRPESRGAYLHCSFFSCFAVHDVITSDTT